MNTLLALLLLADVSFQLVYPGAFKLEYSFDMTNWIYQTTATNLVVVLDCDPLVNKQRYWLLTPLP